MTRAQKRALALILTLPVLASPAFSGEPSPFASRELSVMPSPASASELSLPAGSTVVDLDLWPTGPDVLILIHNSGGNHVVSWHAGDSRTVPLLDLPANFTATSIAAHPIEHRFFIGGKTGQQSSILVVSNLNGNWTQRTIYQSPHDLRRLLVAPRPFAIGWNEAQKQPIESYRLFFAERQPNGTYSTRSITEEGKREYQVIGPEVSYITLPAEDEPPTPNFVSSALPAAFHPDGHLMIWQDGNGCFQLLAYAGKNWDKPSHLAGNPCGGSLTVTPNGAALLHWKHGVPGVSIIGDHGRTISAQADDYQFISTPSSTPDGRGIVGLVDRQGGQAIVYVPIEVPLADVINAWMFIEDAADRDGFKASSGLFRETREDQMYQLYDTESYACGGYDSATPTRPYLVTTDIFWELLASAYEGTFIVQERQQAVPTFWAFVDAAPVSLSATAPGSTWALAFNAVAQSRGAANATAPEALHIQQAQGTMDSRVFGQRFNFTELTPRGHYTATPELSAYFKAVHYLTSLSAASGAAPLNSLPPSVKAKALRWIAAYAAYIAPSRSPLVWSSDAFSTPDFIRHPGDIQQIFPLSWGFDNEVLLSTVYHSDWPAADQITGPDGPRLLPSGIDLAAAFGSGYARSLLKPDLAAYPALSTVLDALRRRKPQSAGEKNLYDGWIDSLAVQWADDGAFATAKAFAEAGASVVLADWNEMEVKAAAKEFADKGHQTLALCCDVSDDAQVEDMMKQAVATFGRLDAAYNNAGVQNILAETADSPRDDYDRIMGINLRGVWSCMKFELQQMREQGSGAIVNCSSLGGLIGGARRGTYHAAKHGVIGFTKSAALEYATRGIRINAVCPGMIQTPMSDKMIAEGQGEELEKMMRTYVPMQRLGRPEEIADAVLWLCSSAASYVTGQSISVDGGFVMR